MFAKLTYILFTALFLSTSLFAQDLQKQLMANKWFVKGTYLTKTMTFSPVSIPQPEIWEAKFLPNGKLKRCDSVKGSLFDKDGKETKMVMLECDSTATYTIHKDLIQITAGNKNYYYKPTSIPNNTGLEFFPVKPEEFNKK